MQDKNPKSLFGIDINEYTTNVDFKIIDTKIDFLYLRSSGSGTGRFRVDKKFVGFAKESRKFGIPVGAYHFGVPSYDLTDADRQCDDFINILQEGFGPKDYGDLFPVLDVEEPIDEKITVATLVAWVDRFRKRFERKTRRRLMLYTGTFFIELYNDFKVQGKGHPLKNMILWVAMYTRIKGNPPFPPDLGGWTKWKIWQFSDEQKVQGIGNPVDANWGPNNIAYLIQPSVVKGLKATEVGKNVNISWDRVPDVDLVGYNLFANGNWIGTVDVDDTSFKISRSEIPVGKGIPITISIEAFDFDGEVSKVRAKVNL